MYKLDLIKNGVRHPVPNSLKQIKLNKINDIITDEFKSCRKEQCYDCLDEGSRKIFGVEEEPALSENVYHEPALQLIEKHKNGLVLDFGAGIKNTYYTNVVNLDINPYDNTDVVAVGDMLPFKDNSFDAIHSNAVLGHVKNPFACAKELVRVLKPGGDLFCCVPFLQPFHTCPHHYYNMTSEGLKNLFPTIKIRAVDAYDELRPITSLKLLATDYANGLNGYTKEKFLNMKISDIINTSYNRLRNSDIVVELSEEKNTKMACCQTLFGTKPETDETTLKIVSATYGSSTSHDDVAEKIKSLVADNHLTITSNQRIASMFGDPAEGHPKKLKVEWQRLNSKNEVILKGKISCDEYSGKLRTPLIL